MKRLLLAVLALAVLVVGSNFYYAHQARKQLEAVANVLRAMGGKLEYDELRVTLGGNVEIDKIRLAAPGSDDTLLIERVALKTGSILGIHKLALDARKKRLPEALNVSVEGLLLPLGTLAYQQTNLMAMEYSEYLLLSGCGDYTEIGDDELEKMGYGDLVSVDIHSGYRLMNGGQWVEMETHTRMEGMSVSSTQLDFSLNAKSRDLDSLGKALMSAKLSEVTIHYQDGGYLQKLFTFCQQASGASAAEFADLHVEAWESAWEDLGFGVGEEVVAAYRQFVARPDELRISARPLDDIGLKQIADLAPELFPYQFLIDVQINGTALGRLDLQPLQEEQAAEVAPGSLVPIPVARNKAIPIALEQEAMLSQLNQEVRLKLKSGRRLEGRIREVTAEGLQLHSYKSGGSMLIPVTFNQIEEAFLK
jgi:hypothetical protein